jgi:SAM-dependent methyltransferase
VTDDFQRYLRAKRTVDDRALDRRLLETLRERLPPASASTGDPLRVLEVGAGIGTMLTRLLEWDVLPSGKLHYTAVDVRPDNVAALRTHVQEWASDRPVSVSVADADAGPIRLDGPDRRVEVRPVAEEAVSYVDRAGGEWDLLVGAALLDILPADSMERLLDAVAAGGLYYFPIVFDGATRFRPIHPDDRTIERRYHDHMDAKSGGNSRAGGAVLDRLRRADGLTLLGVAGSDWIVRPVDGGYPADEAYFLRHILGTIEEAVGEVVDGSLPELEAWLECRREQLDAGELLYLTHQIDVLGRREASATSAGK